MTLLWKGRFVWIWTVLLCVWSLSYCLLRYSLIEKIDQVLSLCQREGDRRHVVAEETLGSYLERHCLISVAGAELVDPQNDSHKLEALGLHFTYGVLNGRTKERRLYTTIF